MRSRMCILTRIVKTEDELIRFVASPDGGIVADLKCKLPGRGVWVSGDRDSIQKAFEQKRIQKSLALKDDIKIESEPILNTITQMLNQKVLNAYAMARKAGSVILGFEKVAKAIQTGKVIILIEANDGALGGQKKIRSKAKSFYEMDMPYIDNFYTINDLSASLGYENLVHGAVLNSKVSTTVLKAIRKRDQFMGISTDFAHNNMVN